MFLSVILMKTMHAALVRSTTYSMEVRTFLKAAPT